MALVINSNIASMQAQKNLSNTQQQQSVTFQRLSTGLRINSAKDDAGGLFLAEAQTKDIRGLNMATRNAGDGISMAQTAEGALDQIGKNLQRVNELAIQSANGSYNDAARGGLQKEVDELTQEINRIVETTEFNGQKLLSKDATQTDLQIGFKNDAGSSIKTGLEGGLAVQGETRKFGVPGMEGTSFNTKEQATAVAKEFLSKQLLSDEVDPTKLYKSGDTKFDGTKTLANLTSAGTDTSKEIGTNLKALGNGESFTVDGMTFSRQEGAFGDKVGTQLKVEFNGKETTINQVWGDPAVGGGSGLYKDASVVTATNLSDLFGPATSDTAPLANQYFGTGSSVTVGAVAADLKTNDLQVFKDGSLDTLKAGESLEIDGITYARGAGADAVNLTISSAYGTSGAIAGAFGAEGINGMVAAGANMGGEALRNVFANAGNAVQERGVMGDLLTGDLSATKVIDISSQASARAAIDFTRDSIDLVSELRATFGAVQNRFEAVISGNNTYTENLSAARSRVQDADFAQETADLAKQQVLQQAGVSVLGQANASTQSVLGLL